MNINNLKFGDRIQTYCGGQEVFGNVIELKHNEITVKHHPVLWQNQLFEKTRIIKSSPLQRISHSDTTPVAYFKGKKIVCE